MVPVALHAWLSHPGDVRKAVLAAVHRGGDTDTTAAITGAIVGAGVGATWIWRSGCLAPGIGLGASMGRAAAVTRNLVFTAIILSHGVRRAAFVRD